MLKLFFGFCLSVFLFSACLPLKKVKTKETEVMGSLDFKVQEAPEWSQLFNRHSGWMGADGIFFIPKNGLENGPASDSSEHLILFSDTIFGDAVKDSLKGRVLMVHNSVGLLRGMHPDSGQLQFYFDTTEKGTPETMFIPRTDSSKPGDYYWLGDGFVNTEKNNTTYVFAYRMKNLDPNDDWSFSLSQTNLIAIPNGSKPPFKEHYQIETPLRFHGLNPDYNGTLGAGVFVNTLSAGVKNGDGYIYVYGVLGKAKNLVAARVKPRDFESFEKWKFYDGKKWQSEKNNASAICSGVSDELSLTPLKDGRYLLVYQMGGMGSQLAMRVGQTPVGPFGPVIKVFECPEMKENKKYFCYNAKAHPSISKEGELIISYNVNSFDFWKEIKTNPNLYRPRFIKLIFQ